MRTSAANLCSRCTTHAKPKVTIDNYSSPQLQQVCMLNHNSTRALLHLKPGSHTAEFMAAHALVTKIRLAILTHNIPAYNSCHICTHVRLYKPVLWFDCHRASVRSIKVVG